ncbi:MAG: 4Fe-4S dicluster domain-containing protein [candidate division KSB1 bacterium]|nr:4Fe-4S dicluster domain-containing protein [candidate division KSB1 bacterium]MDZ7300703.1 4Fe-4S dicluster domain-containing protein [candidate division KSB1 bacterium]MDZ7310027.1 4Fe-4S dicluster domain-containing protein [candidate division KSB1 bacterium]
MNHEDQHNTTNAHTPAGIDRRSFLKLAGFSFASACLAGCEKGRVEKAIPFLIQPEEITPGLAYWYATTCAGCNAGCGVMAKCIDGRPIKLEGNPAHPLSRGGLCAVGQASLLGLYDSHRLKNPLRNGRETTWDQLDGEMMKELETIRRNGGAVRFLTSTLTSPTTRAMISTFLRGFQNAKHVQYDAISYSAILDAHKVTHGERLLPRYRFDQAEVIVSFDADFLGNWFSPVEFTKGYRAGRTLEGDPPRCSFHAHFESRLSLTGSNADERLCVSPAEMYESLKRLAELLAVRSGKPLAVHATLSPAVETKVSALADRLWKARGKSLVICGMNNRHGQLLVNAINDMLDNYGRTVDIARPSYQYAGNDAELEVLLREIRSGTVTALFVAEANPVYDLPDGAVLREALKKIPLVVSFAERVDETADCARFVCPTPHALETWIDHEPAEGVVAISQPTIPPLRNSRPLIESLAAWMGIKESALDLIQREWERTVFTRQAAETSFTKFWNKTLETGYAEVQPKVQSSTACDYAALAAALASSHPPAVADSDYTLILFPSLTMLDGRHAHNPWLHELPDPITKIVWDNVASVSRTTAEKLGVKEGDVLRIEANGSMIEMPTHIQPGQHDGVVAVALGYGRKGTDRFTNIGPSWLQARPTVAPGELVGKNAAHFVHFLNGHLSYLIGKVSLQATGTKYTLAKTQEYDLQREPNLFGKQTSERRRLIQETTLAAYAMDRSAGSFHREPLDSMWPEDHKYLGYRWGMVIDLNACTGCSACVMACQAENNIPVVGKDEVRRNREMSWIRIDRYYDEDNGTFSVAHQPMLCQHCAHAPCETVCPVLATVHNEEGLNQQIYNRCVGTRYCANNCPYKVRRFNWFQYRHGDEMHKMVLNPDVTVRDRGVMEKCSFCIQRIQLAKIEAKRDGRPLQDGDVQPACVQSCPAQAIVFGDMNDPNSEVSKRMKDPRYYRVLEELGVHPAVGYMTLVRNRDKKTEVPHG